MDDRFCEISPEDAYPDDWTPGPEITRELYLEWRDPRFGLANPEVMTNPVWTWLALTRIPAYGANKHFEGPNSCRSTAAWSNDRFGQSLTHLPDGRVMLIAGEHEDHYDPDFHIYNDVMVRDVDGSIRIYGYPREVFPPTDFHSATLHGDRILILGNLGYPQERKPGETPVFSLDTNTLAIERIETHGSPPGWIHEHTAELSEDGSSVLLRGGRVRHPEENVLVENLHDWRLDLTTWRWELFQKRDWTQIEVFRADRELDSPGFNFRRYQPDLESLQNACPGASPAMHLPLRKDADGEDDFDHWAIQVRDVVVRYVIGFRLVRMTVEGVLPHEIPDFLAEDLRKALVRSSRAPFEIRRIPAFPL